MHFSIQGQARHAIQSLSVGVSIARPAPRVAPRIFGPAGTVYCGPSMEPPSGVIDFFSVPRLQGSCEIH
jgi:hypothetical protein